MPSLTYWYCECLNDSDCYSIVAKTKKEATRLRAESYEPENYELPVKKVIQYDDGFDLLRIVGSEGGGMGAGYTAGR